VRLSLVVLMMILSISLFGQTYDGWNLFIHQKNIYTPVESALSNMPSYVNPSLYAHTYNPAFTGMVEGNGLETTMFKYSPAPFSDTRVRTLNGHVNINNNNALAISYYEYNINYEPGFFSSDFEYSTATLSYSRKVTENIYAGAGLNYMKSNEAGNSDLKIFTLDIGGIYTNQFHTWENVLSNFVVQVSINNLAGSVTEDVRTGSKKLSDYIDVYPVILELGVANQFVMNKILHDLNVFTLSTQVEYTNSLNDPYFDYLRFGVEFSFFEMFYLRAGHVEFLTQTLEDMMGETAPKESYGLGLEIPVHKFYNFGVECKVIFNYGQSYQNTEGSKIDEFNSYSIGVLIN